jgi:hypothetical protein
MRVEIWGDIGCPWCYIGKARFEEGLAAFTHRDEIEVVYRSFELEPGWDNRPSWCPTGWRTNTGAPVRRPWPHRSGTRPPHGPLDSTTVPWVATTATPSTSIGYSTSQSRSDVRWSC